MDSHPTPWQGVLTGPHLNPPPLTHPGLAEAGNSPGLQVASSRTQPGLQVAEYCQAGIPGCLAAGGITNGYPWTPALIQQPQDRTLASWTPLLLFLFLLCCGCMLGSPCLRPCTCSSAALVALAGTRTPRTSPLDPSCPRQRGSGTPPSTIHSTDRKSRQSWTPPPVSHGLAVLLAHIVWLSLQLMFHVRSLLPSDCQGVGLVDGPG